MLSAHEEKDGPGRSRVVPNRPKLPSKGEPDTAVAETQKFVPRRWQVTAWYSARPTASIATETEARTLLLQKSLMNFLPKAAGSRPRLACEISASGIVAARSPEPGLPVAAVARLELAEGAVTPSLRPGNIPDRIAALAALRQVLERVGGRAGARNADLTLVIPDAAVRVLLLEFDTLPSKLSEALPLVRFRLKKLVPFDADQAMVSFQVMSTSRAMVRVLAVAIPRDVLSEYESVAREAGFEPGAVLPSTLAALAALSEGEGASLVVNAHAQGVTTAILRAGIVLLHRSIEMAELASPLPAGFPPALFEGTGATEQAGLLTFVDREDSQAEWSAQEALPEHGRDPYADRISTEEPVQDQDAVTGFNSVGRVLQGGASARGAGARVVDMYAAAEEAAPVGRSPYASPLLQGQLEAQFQNAAYVAPLGQEAFGTSGSAMEAREPARVNLLADGEDSDRIHRLAPDLQAEEIARAVSVAVAYFEDALGAMPEVLLSAGPLGAERLQSLLGEQGMDSTLR